jgi:hypothetical protein
MKRESEIKGLITGSDKSDILIVTMPEPGKYFYRDLQLNQKELNELKKNYNRCVIMRPRIYY